MTKKIITQSRPKGNQLEFNEALSKLSIYYNKPTNLVIQHLYTKFDYSYTDISKILSMSVEAVRSRFPKAKGDK